MFMACTSIPLHCQCNAHATTNAKGGDATLPTAIPATADTTIPANSAQLDLDVRGRAFADDIQVTTDASNQADVLVIEGEPEVTVMTVILSGNTRVQKDLIQGFLDQPAKPAP
jgi:hypothetical protein